MQETSGLFTEEEKAHALEAKEKFIATVKVSLICSSVHAFGPNCRIPVLISPGEKHEILANEFEKTVKGQKVQRRPKYASKRQSEDMYCLDNSVKSYCTPENLQCLECKAPVTPLYHPSGDICTYNEYIIDCYLDSK
jgi:hypothetical protein